MKLKMRSAITILGCAAAALALAKWSASIGRKVWSPEVFAWRNPLKPQPNIGQQEDCPVRLIHPRFYSFMSLGSSIGSVLRLDVKNVSDKPIHSFSISYHCLDPLDTGGAGWHPQTLLPPKQSFTIGQSSRGSERVTILVDFVQFADGEVWHPNPSTDHVKPEGVRAGTQASVEYLRQVLETKGVAVVMSVLPLIRMKVEFPSAVETSEAFGSAGFYCGITNTVVRVESAYQKSGLSGVEEFLLR